MIGGVVGSFLVPGVGAVLAAGVLGAALLGTGGAEAGAAAGRAADEAITKASLRNELHIYEESLRSGHTVLVAVAEDEGQAEAARARLARAGGRSSSATRESWWGQLRAAEEEAYVARGRDFAADEALYRRGFEAALHPDRRGKSFEEAAESLRGRYGEDYPLDAFRSGYERGRAHHEALTAKSRQPAGGRNEDATGH